MRTEDKKQLIAFLCCLVIYMLGPPASDAQDFDRIAPKKWQPAAHGSVELFSSTFGSFDKMVSKEWRPAGHGSIELFSPILEVTGIVAEKESPRVEALKGVVFLENSSEVKKEALSGIEGIQAERFPLLQTEDFKEIAASYFGKPISMDSLNKLAEQIVLYYRKRDRPIVHVIIPEQEISNGIVQLVVFEGRLGELVVTGNQWTSEEKIREKIRLNPGEIIAQEKLLADLDWINRNPFRSTHLVYAPGEKPGSTKLEIRVKDRFPMRPYAGFENTGNDLTGDERWFVGFNWGDVLGWEHLLSYQFTTSSDLEMLRAHSATYSIPLPWRHFFNLFGSQTKTHADVAPPLDLEGHSWQVGARYIVPFVKTFVWDELAFQHEISAGFDFKQSDSNLEFGGTPVTETLTDVTQWMLAWDAAFDDPWGTTSLNVSGFYSPGGWTGHSKDPAYNAARANAEAQYAYGKVSVYRQTTLPWDFSLHNSFSYQRSTTNLLGSEQFGLGGRDTIRGYDEREVNADEGWFVRNELHTPPVSLGVDSLLGSPQFTDQLIFLAFWDYGAGGNKHLLVGENKDVELSGIGGGLRYSIGPYLSISADFGFQLLDTGNNDRNNSRCHLSFIFSY